MNPAIWNRRIYRGTDHTWPVRWVTDQGPIIPESARAQVRGSYRGALWVDCDIEIDPVEGWVHVIIPESATAGEEWNSRRMGVWDLEVTIDGSVTRWAQGRIEVSQEATQ